MTLAVRNISASYGGVQALRNVSLEVRDGEMVALLGANGAGKTTTLRAISGLLAPSEGEIEFDQRPIQGVPAHKLVRVGLAHLPEGRDLFPSLTVEENLKYGHWVRRKDHADYRAQLDLVMDYFPRLRERRGQVARTLSGGEQQMLGVARALMSSPRLLLIDELSLGLAPMIVSQLFDILRAINANGTSVLLVEQFVHMALANTHRAYVLSKGAIVLEGPSSELEGRADLVASYLGSTEERPPDPPSESRRERRRAARPAPA